MKKTFDKYQCPSLGLSISLSGISEGFLLPHLKDFSYFKRDLNRRIIKDYAFKLEMTSTKEQLIMDLFKSEYLKSAKSIVILVQFQNDADRLTQYLSGKKIKVEAYHGGKSGSQKEDLRKRLFAGRIRVLIATSLSKYAYQGKVDAVIHFCLPKSFQDYYSVVFSSEIQVIFLTFE